MIVHRPAAERGAAEHGWLSSRFTFSFADYHDPKHMGFRVLRVINDDTVSPAKGFGTHGHKDMEIISYVLDGALSHKDSMGNGSTIRPGDVQRMSAGTGVRHSEFNGSNTEFVHFLQIWILPESRDLAPGYEEKRFTPEEKRGQLRLIASRAGRDGSVRINQDVDVYATLLDGDDKVELALRAGRHAWVHVARGNVKLGDLNLSGGDGVAISDEPAVRLSAGVVPAEVLVFDLP